mmetsp:Transcript_62992/g.178993  ORF Transcript_62992/g.178993 Transcript_62992/m.178993 type:complete len:589 (-) Transcript_62992:138-1904(-)
MPSCLHAMPWPGAPACSRGSRAAAGRGAGSTSCSSTSCPAIEKNGGVEAAVRQEEAEQRRRLTPASTGCEVVWQFESESGWRSFSFDAGRNAEAAYNDGVSSTLIANEGKDYKMDFTGMTQENQGGRRRRVRRYLAAPPQLAVMWHHLASSFKSERRRCSDPDPLPELRDGVLERLETLAGAYAGPLLRGNRELPVPAWRNVHGDAHVVLAAASVAFLRLYAHTEDAPQLSFCCGYDQDELRSEMEEVLRQARHNPRPATLVLSEVRSPDGDIFGWLRKANDPHSRLDRLCQACVTLAHCRGTSHMPSLPPVHHAFDLAKRTQLIERPRGGTVFGGPPGPALDVRFRPERTLLEVAVELVQRGQKVAVVNAASAYHPGGGFLTGGRHALEEALCTQSTLYLSLARAAEMAAHQNLRDERGRRIHIPEHGCVLSPSVEVFRHGTNRGYAPMDKAVRLEAVLSMAMPNRNLAVTDSPYDRAPPQELQGLVQSKFQTVVEEAARAGARALVVPDAGCGAFGHDPRQVGWALGKVLRDYGGALQEVVLVGHPDFASAAYEAAGLAPPRPAREVTQQSRRGPPFPQRSRSSTR